MAQKKTGTSSASTEKKQQATVAEIKEKMQFDSDPLKSNYSKAKDALIKFRDPNRNINTSITRFSRETLRAYLQAPASNEKNLRDAARYLFYRSQVLYRVIMWYAGMWDLNCRKVVPPYSVIKDNNPDKMLKSFEQTLDQLEIYNLQGNIFNILVRCYLEDVCYSVFLRDKTGAIFYILDPDECRIDGKYLTGDFSFSIDASKWRSAERRELAEWLGEPFVSILREYDANGTRWVHVDDKYAACFKFRSENWQTIVPPFSPIFQDLVGVIDLADIQAVADEQSIFKLLVYPMKILSGAKNSDDFEVSPDLAIEYFNQMVERSLPPYISAAPLPGDGVDVVDFSESNQDKDTDRIQNAIKNLMGTSGGGVVLNANMVNNTAIFAAWLCAETQFALSSLLPQINGFTNRMLSYDVSGDPCHVEHFEVSVYTKDELAEKLLESNQYSYPNRLAYNTLLGISEKETLAMLYFENTVLGLPDTMRYPLSSSFTSTGEGETGEIGQGRPEVEPIELSPSGERSRNE